MWDAASDTLMECTTERCPFAVPHSVTGRLVNYAPFFAEGGECYGLRAAAPERKKDLMFDLFTWFSTLNPQLVPLTGIYRKSQLSSDTLDVLSRQLNPTMADDLLQVRFGRLLEWKKKRAYDGHKEERKKKLECCVTCRSCSPFFFAPTSF